MGRAFMTWVGTNAGTGTRGWNELSQYAHKFKKIGLFEWVVKDTTGHIYNMAGQLCGPPTAQEMSLIQQFPQIQWYISIQALGSNLQALWTNQNGAQDTFMADLATLLAQNPWCAGVDLDFEQGGSSVYTNQAVAFFRRIYNYVHGLGKLVHVDLPGLTGPGQSLGGEYWCDYAQLAPYFDSCTIMTYGYSWAGSAPGPIAPASWVTAVYNYAVTVIPPHKVYLGIGGYGLLWEIDHDPGNSYRASSGTYNYFLGFMLGLINYSQNQPQIPWAAFWDDDEKSAWMLVNVYDYQTPDDATSITYPTQKGTYNGWPFTSAYNKVQKPQWSGWYTQVPATSYTSASGALVWGSGYVTGRAPQKGETPGTVTYTFSVPSSGTYQLVLNVNLPWWNIYSLAVKIDGQQYVIPQPAQWYPLWRQPHWFPLATVNLSAGQHTLTITWDGTLSQYGVQFFGFAIAQGFSFTMDGGSSQYTLVPQEFIDINGNPARPSTGYVLAVEMLRHPPEYALVWSDDFRTYPGGGDSLTNWYALTGNWQVQGTAGNPSTLIGSGQILLKYDSFGDLCVYADFSFTGSEAGIIMGPNKIGLTSDGRVVFNGSTLGTASTSGSHRLRVRCRQGTYDVWLDGNHIGTTTGSGSNKFGLYTASDAQIQCTTLYAGDAYWMMPEEAITITTPTGTETLGRIQRTGVTWDNTWGYFMVPAGTEEINTRTGGRKNISSDFDYFNSQVIQLQTLVPVTIQAADIGVWVRRLFLCDKDGAGIGYYCDLNYTRYWMDQADDKWGLAGTAMWALGLEDPKIFAYIPDQW